MRFFLLLSCFTVLSYNIRSQSDGFLRVDRRAQNVPKSVTRDYKLLAHYLIKPAHTDIEKARVLYKWVTNYFQYDVVRWKKIGSFKEYSVQEIISRKKGVCRDLAMVYKALCDEVGLDCHYVTGSVPRKKFGLFASFEGHAWNIVKIDDKWHHVDPTWGTGFVVKKSFMKKKIDKGKLWRMYKKNTTISHNGKWYFWKKPNNNYLCPSQSFFNQTHCADLAFMQLQNDVMHRFEFLRGKHKTLSRYKDYNYLDSLDKYENRQYENKELFELHNTLPVITRKRYDLSIKYRELADSFMSRFDTVTSVDTVKKYRTYYKRAIKYHFGNGLFSLTRHAFFLGFGVKSYMAALNIKSNFLQDVTLAAIAGGSIYYISRDFYIHELKNIIRLNNRIRKLKKK